MLIDKTLMDKIEVLTEMVNIALIGENVFVYHNFEASVSSNVASVDFNTISGMCITSFVSTNVIDPTLNTKNFLAKFTTYIENRQPMTIRFNKTTDYILFSR